MSEVRPPQQARAHATRARLVDAASCCLVDCGFAGATTSVVAQKAGVSQGALFKHFPSKARLLAACVAENLARFFDVFRERLAERALEATRPACGAAGVEESSSPCGAGTPAAEAAALTDLPLEARITPTVGALWSIFRSDALRAVFEVYVAARTDMGLEAALGPILEAHRARILAEARLLFPEVAAHEEFDAAIDAIVYAMQGAALGLFGSDARNDAKNLALFERLARRELAQLSEPRTPEHRASRPRRS